MAAGHRRRRRAASLMVPSMALVAPVIENDGNF
jgi:hypothetical protein